MGKKKKKFKKHNYTKTYYNLNFTSKPHEINTIAFKVFGSLYYHPSDN